MPKARRDMRPVRALGCHGWWGVAWPMSGFAHPDHSCPTGKGRGGGGMKSLPAAGLGGLARALLPFPKPSSLFGWSWEGEENVENCVSTTWKTVNLAELIPLKL